jgi:threonine dehydrogenase-like Zn-dependent dehydrogenase
MKAAQYFGQNDIRIVDVPEPNPKEHEALLAIEWCGICGSDLHEYLHGEPLTSQTYSLQHLDFFQAP